MRLLEDQINEMWTKHQNSEDVDSRQLIAINDAIGLLDSGELRIAEVKGREVVVHEWLKRAILLHFQHSESEPEALGQFQYFDCVPLKTGIAATGARVLPVRLFGGDPTSRRVRFLCLASSTSVLG